MDGSKSIAILLIVGYSISAMGAVDPKECEKALAAHTASLQSRAGFDQTEKSDFAALGQIRPHNLRKEPLGTVVDVLARLAPGAKSEDLSPEDIGKIIKDRQKEMSPQLEQQLEGLLDSPDSHKVEAALIALENLKSISPAAQLKIAALIGIEAHSRTAIDVLSEVRNVAPKAFEKVAQLAAANARAGREIWFTKDPESLLRRIQPLGGDKGQALISAGFTSTEVDHFNRLGKISPQPIATMGISSVVSALISLEPDQEFEGAGAVEIGQAIRDRHAEITPQLQTEIEKLLSSKDAKKVKAALEILEKVRMLSVQVQEQVAELVGNKSFARDAVDVLEDRRTVAASAYQIVAQLALANARQGIEIWFTEDPEALLRRLKPADADKDGVLEKAGLTAAERQDFEKYGEIRPNPLKKMALGQVIDELAKLERGAKFLGKDAGEIGGIIKSRTSELTHDLITRLEGLLESPGLHTVKGALVGLEKVKTITPRAQLKIAQLVAIKAVARDAIDVLENLQWVSADAYTTVAALARSNAEQKIEVWFTEDPERLLKYIKPIDGVVNVTGEDMAAAIDARKKIEDLEVGLQALDQERQREQHMAEQRRINPQIRTGETDISESQRRSNLADLQRRASPILLRGAYNKPQPNTVTRWQIKVSQPAPVGPYSGIFVVTTGSVESFKGKQAMSLVTVVEYDPEFHFKFNVATVHSTTHSAFENGQWATYIEHGEKPGWQVTNSYGEPEENKSVAQDLGHTKHTYVWKYVGDFTAPNGVQYKKCYKLTAFDAENKEMFFSIFTPGIGGVYTKSQGSEMILESMRKR